MMRLQELGVHDFTDWERFRARPPNGMYACETNNRCTDGPICDGGRDGKCYDLHFYCSARAYDGDRRTVKIEGDYEGKQLELF